VYGENYGRDHSVNRRTAGGATQKGRMGKRARVLDGKNRGCKKGRSTSVSVGLGQITFRGKKRS